ncbi:hypothetical protein JRQ81_000860, partial [Phrynocephalus forsythii]
MDALRHSYTCASSLVHLSGPDDWQCKVWMDSLGMYCLSDKYIKDSSLSEQLDVRLPK